MADRPTAVADSNAKEFVDYYAKQSVTPEALRRSQRILELVGRFVAGRREDLHVADIGCGPGAQSRIWAMAGYRVHGVDINPGLLALAREGAREAGLEIDWRQGSADALPFSDACMDVCLAPELLEHVPDWQASLRELTRILKPGGVLYLSTTNRLCPSQMEFDLPFYSWYPTFLKRYYERLAVTTRRDLVSHATYPAVHWFTFYQLSDFLRPLGLDAKDRFDLIDLEDLGKLGRFVVQSMRAMPPLRWVGHVFTPYSVVLAIKTR